MTGRFLLTTAVVLGMATALAEQAPVVEDSTAAQAEAGELGSVDNLAAVERLAALNDALLQHQREGRITQALQVAREMVATIEDQYGDSDYLYEPLNTIVDLELELGNNQAAEQTLVQLIALIELQEGIFSAQLVEPLTRLAAINSTSDRQEGAITLLRRARHITHRQQGILNIDQIELAERLADNYFRLGKIEEGSRENRFAFRVNIHEYGGDSAALVPALNKLAAWYERIGEYSAARSYYLESVALIENDHGADDLRLVDALQKVANTYRKQRAYRGDGLRALVRAVDIHESHPESDEVAYAESLTKLGDWMLSTSHNQDAMELYDRAWNILTTDGAYPERGDLLFGQPRRVRYDPPVPVSSRFVTEMYVDIECIVTPEGSVKEIEIIGATADWRTQSEVKSAMRHARFRPQYVDGKPVPARIRTRWSYALPEHVVRQQTVGAKE